MNSVKKFEGYADKSLLVTDQAPVCSRAEGKFLRAFEAGAIERHEGPEVIVSLVDIRRKISRVVVRVEEVFVKTSPYGEHTGIVRDDSPLNGFLVYNYSENPNDPALFLARPLYALQNRAGHEELRRRIGPEFEPRYQDDKIIWNWDLWAGSLYDNLFVPDFAD